MGRLVLAVVVLLCVAFSAEAARKHEHFSQGSYYDKTVDESTAPVRVEVDSTPDSSETPVQKTDPVGTTPSTTGVPDRYPNGYPDQEQFSMQSKVAGGDPEAAFSSYRGVNVKYSAAGESSEVIPDRYPNGYPGSENPLYSKETDPEAKFATGKFTRYSAANVDNTAEIKPDNTATIPDRYPNGYYGDARDSVTGSNEGEADLYSSSKAHVKFSVGVDQGLVPQEKQETPAERYPTGYYPGLNTNSEVSGSQKQGANFAQYSGSQSSRYGYDGVQGDFSTSYEIPYELTGGGCPTQYWIANTQKWPKFFSVKSTIGDAFGEKATAVFGETTILQALLDTRTDGYSSLLRSGATAILNAYSRAQYQFKAPLVIKAFTTGLESREDAAKQAASFQEANVSAFSTAGAGTCS